LAALVEERVLSVTAAFPLHQVIKERVEKCGGISDLRRLNTTPLYLCTFATTPASSEARRTTRMRVWTLLLIASLRAARAARVAKRSAEDADEAALGNAAQAIADNVPRSKIGDCVAALVLEIEREGQSLQIVASAEADTSSTDEYKASGDSGNGAKRARIAVALEAVWRRAFA
jgi:hypothetical protein